MQNLAISADQVGFIVAAILSLFVFSYLLGDNALYRFAEHLFVGVAVGYAVIVAFHYVLGPRLLLPFMEALEAGDTTQMGLLLVPLILGLLLLFKSTQREGAISWVGSLGVAFLLGVGAAVAIGGGLLGTLFPQVAAASNVTHYRAGYGPVLGLLSGVLIVAGTTGVLLHFYFSGRSEGRFGHFHGALVRVWGGLGWWFILVAFGALLATTFMSRLSLLAGRIQFLIDGVRQLGGG